MQGINYFSILKEFMLKVIAPPLSLQKRNVRVYIQNTSREHLSEDTVMKLDNEKLSC